MAREFYGLELTEAVLRSHWGKPSRELVDIFYPASETTDLKLAKFHSLDQQFPKTLLPGAISAIERLAKLGLVLGIVSNARKASVEHDIERLNLPTHHFHFIHAYEDTGAYKPDPAAFDLALSFLRDKEIQDITYVGDSLTDLEASNSAGIEFIGVATGLATASDFIDAGARQTVQSLGELVALFDGIRTGVTGPV